MTIFNLTNILIFLIGLGLGFNIAIFMFDHKIKKLTKKLWTERSIKKTHLI